ncbi:hypothetical protein NDA11_000928, partial [Ustilago hordei]
HEEEEQCRRS